MKKNTAYIIAVLACCGVFIIYAVIWALLGWFGDGGIIAMLILMAVLTATWKGIVGMTAKDIIEEDKN
jgi:fatty acid desaturase